MTQDIESNHQVFYRRTTPDLADAVLRDGFTDTTGFYLTTEETSGVWLSNVLLDAGQGPVGHAVLRITVPAGLDLSFYEWVEEEKPYREWQVPAALLNEHATVELIDEEDAPTGF